METKKKKGEEKETGIYLLTQHLRKTIEAVVAAHGSNGDTNKWMNMVKSQLAKKIPDHNRLRSMGKQ